MQKPLPSQTPRTLNPPAGVLTPYTFFENVSDHPLAPLDTGLNLRNAWWLCDAALLAYSAEETVSAAFATAGIQGEVAHIRGTHSTQAYVTSMPEALVLAFRGTQVDDFWSSVLDFTVDARFLPVPDSHGDSVHAGFLAALGEVWPRTLAHLRDDEAAPVWWTGERFRISRSVMTSVAPVGAVGNAFCAFSKERWTRSSASTGPAASTGGVVTPPTPSPSGHPGAAGRPGVRSRSARRSRATNGGASGCTSPR